MISKAKKLWARITCSHAYQISGSPFYISDRNVGTCRKCGKVKTFYGWNKE